MPTYATTDDLAAYTGTAAPDNAAALLAKASRMLDSAVFRLCWYQADGDGLPTNPLVQQAFKDACCAQAAWWDELGDSTGAMGAGWGSVQIGSVNLSRSVTNVSAEASPARQIASEVWDVLRSPDLTPDVLTIGLVIS
ncbi:hypothetical protein [Streptomyces sp. NPDC020983]|uniref:hypothetical protein n=1 Tax=Streptomyces sp. NPDC020983 TaxID=3365106 RepID=UPI0037BC7E4B